LTGLSLSDFKQIVHHGSELQGIPHNVLHVWALVSVQFTGQAVIQDRGKLTNRGEWCTKLVRDMREEFILELQLLLVRPFAVRDVG